MSPDSEQTWKRYSASLIVFSGVALLVTYGIFRLQAVLPFNPQHLPGVTPALAWNTSVSFVTNTNWQAYSGESTMSYLSQMGSLAVQNFLSAAVGIAVAVALIRGFVREGGSRIMIAAERRPDCRALRGRYRGSQSRSARSRRG